MPQTAPKIQLYTRVGGLEPAIKICVGSIADLNGGKAAAFADAVRRILSDSLAFSRWEGRLANNSFVTGGAFVGKDGLWPSTYTDMADNVHVTFTSGGASRPSSFFLQGRAANIITDGIRNGAYDLAVGDMMDDLIAASARDSEGSALTGIKDWQPSRRENLRVAP